MRRCFASSEILPIWNFFSVQYSFFLSQYIDHGGRWPRPRQVGAQYRQPVAQKIAIGLL